ELDIKFPETEAEQRAVAEGFRRKSEIGIDCCCGAVDGMLVWIHKPSTRDERVIGIGPKKFFCGRKKKFGLNMQGVCDSRGFFLDVEVRFPGAASDFFAFDESGLKKKVEKEGFLGSAPSSLFGGKLCLFGDNAYVQTPYMCTPWKAVSGGSKDAFNFFHSQVRINIECAFGMLVHRWGILRRAIPMGIDVNKTTRLVLALCKLHNFCIASQEGVVAPYERDLSTIVLDGGCNLPRMDQGDDIWEYDMSEDSVAEVFPAKLFFRKLQALDNCALAEALSGDKSLSK
ncbi:hypothetical protein THAOC_11427, partial [Thalassiosira oceanica]